MTIILIILVILLLGGGGYGRWGGNASFGAGYGNASGILGIVLLVLLVFMLLRVAP